MKGGTLLEMIQKSVHGLSALTLSDAIVVFADSLPLAEGVARQLALQMVDALVVRHPIKIDHTSLTNTRRTPVPP